VDTSPCKRPFGWTWVHAMNKVVRWNPSGDKVDNILLQFLGALQIWASISQFNTSIGKIFQFNTSNLGIQASISSVILGFHWFGWRFLSFCINFGFVILGFHWFGCPFCIYDFRVSLIWESILGWYVISWLIGKIHPFKESGTNVVQVYTKFAFAFQVISWQGPQIVLHRNWATKI